AKQREDLARYRDVFREVGRHDDETGTPPHRLRHRESRPHAERTRLVARGGDHAAPLRVAADDDRLAFELRIVTLLDGPVERVHVDVEDAADDRAHAGILRRDRLGGAVYLNQFAGSTEVRLSRISK